MKTNREPTLFEIAPPGSLKARVYSSIERCRRRAARRKLWLFGLSFLAAAAAFVPAAMMLAADSAASGFSQIIGLFGSDGGTLTRFFADFFWYALETLPVSSMILSGVILLLLVASAAKFFETFRSQRHGRAIFA